MEIKAAGFFGIHGLQSLLVWRLWGVYGGCALRKAWAGLGVWLVGRGIHEVMHGWTGVSGMCFHIFSPLPPPISWFLLFSFPPLPLSCIHGMHR